MFYKILQSFKIILVQYCCNILCCKGYFTTSLNPLYLSTHCQIPTHNEEIKVTVQKLLEIVIFEQQFFFHRTVHTLALRAIPLPPPPPNRSPQHNTITLTKYMYMYVCTILLSKLIILYLYI